jgi:acetyltransferase-like isoleucine patch superfamily enzyme
MTSFEETIWARPWLKRMLNYAYVDAIHILHLCLDLVPWFVRNAAWRMLLRECGARVNFDHHVYVKFPRLVCIGHDVSINRGVEFYGSLRNRSLIRIGSNVRIAPHVRFHAAGHDPDHRDFVDTGADIQVGDECWIGAGTLVLQGVTIGRGAVIAAGSVVTRDIPSGCIAGGAPARVLRERRIDAPPPGSRAS